MKTLLTLRSLTYAQKGQRMLARARISAHLIRTPEEYASRGCSYGLLVDDPDRAADLLTDSGITILGSYPYRR